MSSLKGYAFFEENGLKGLKNLQEEVLVPARYVDIEPVTGYSRANAPVAVADVSGKYALLWPFDPDRTVTGFEYDEFIYLDDIFVFLCRKGERYNVIGYDDERIFNADLDAVHHVCKGVYVVESDGCYGILTGSDMESNFEPVLDEVTEDNGNIYVCLDGTWGYIDEGGEFISGKDYDPDFDEVMRFGCEVLDWSWQSGSEVDSYEPAAENSAVRTLDELIRSAYSRKIDWSEVKAERKYALVLYALGCLWGDPGRLEDVVACLESQPRDFQERIVNILK